MSMCFLDMQRNCGLDCIAYSDDGKTTCRILNTFERLVPPPTRPTPPAPPKVNP